jgi:hypothetical protein
MMEQPSATPTHDTNERVSERVSEFQTRAASLRHSRTHSHTPSRTSTPWYLSHCLFLAILMVRVLRHTSERVIPWWLTFSPLLLACATLLLVKSSEAYITFTHTRANSLTHAHTHSQNSYRVYCALVDHVGYTTTVVLACVYLSTHSLTHSNFGSSVRSTHDHCYSLTRSQDDELASTTLTHYRSTLYIVAVQLPHSLTHAYSAAIATRAEDGWIRTREVECSGDPTVDDVQWRSGGSSAVAVLMYFLSHSLQCFTTRARDYTHAAVRHAAARAGCVLLLVLLLVSACADV